MGSVSISLFKISYLKMGHSELVWDGGYVGNNHPQTSSRALP